MDLSKKKISANVAFDPDVIQVINKIAAKEKLKFSEVVRKLVNIGLENYKK